MRTQQSVKILSNIEMITRIGVFFSFVSYGLVFLNTNPKWVPDFLSFGFTKINSQNIIKFIGFGYFLLACLIFLFPNKKIIFSLIVLSAISTFSMIYCNENILDVVRNFSNIFMPLILFYLFSNKRKRRIKIRDKREIKID